MKCSKCGEPMQKRMFACGCMKWKCIKCNIIGGVVKE